MKTQNITAILFLFLLLTAGISPIRGYAQEQNPADITTILTGTWTFDLDASVNAMLPEARAYYDKMDATRHTRFTSHYSGRQYIFSADGTFLQQLPNGSQISGTWLLNDTGSTLKMTASNGDVFTGQIGYYSNNNLVLQIPNSGTMKVMLAEWHLTKN